jgi:hypothetical protein
MRHQTEQVNRISGHLAGRPGTTSDIFAAWTTNSLQGGPFTHSGDQWARVAAPQRKNATRLPDTLLKQFGDIVWIDPRRFTVGRMVVGTDGAVNPAPRTVAGAAGRRRALAPGVPVDRAWP